jgi:hypothetical protein
MNTQTMFNSSNRKPHYPADGKSPPQNQQSPMFAQEEDLLFDEQTR